MKKKKKSELVKLNANTKLLLEMEADLERMKTDFYSRAPAQGFHEERAAYSGVVDLSGGRDVVQMLKLKRARLRLRRQVVQRPQQKQLTVKRYWLMQQTKFM